MRLKRVLAVVLVVVLVVVGVGFGALVWVTGRALPQTSGTLTVPGLERPVTVVRDVAGIAHIRAETVHDLFMAQGFVHAQERMWQMEVWRHISAGRLAEMFGESQLDTDRFIRTLGWRQATERDLAAMAPEARAVLDAYAQGINAWLDQERDSLGLAFLVTERSRNRGRPSTRSAGRRSRRGTSAATWTRSCSGSSPTPVSATRRAPTSCSRPIRTMRR